MSGARRLTFIAVTAVLAVVAAGIVTFLMLRPSKAGNVELTTARLVPADAAVYFGLNTDLNSTQWVQAFNFAKRLGRSNPKQELRDSAKQDGDLDWQTQIAPFLGGDAAFYFKSLDVSDPGSVQGAAILRCQDAGKCLSVLESKVGDLQTATYRGVQYQFNQDNHTYFARVQDHVIVAANEDSLDEVLDTQSGRKPSLDSVADFKSLRNELTNTFLGLVYLNTGELLSNSGSDVSLLEQALKDSGAPGLATKPAALVIGAKAGSIEFQAASIAKTSDTAPLLQPHTSRFAKVVPGDSAIFVSAGGVSQTWNQIVKNSQQQIDDALAQQGYSDGLDALLQQAGQQLGLNSLQDAIDLFNGEIAVAAWFPSQRNAGPEGVVLAEVKSEQQARDLLSKALTGSGDKPTTERVGDADVTIVRGSDGSEYAYTVTNGYLAVGTRSSVRKLLTQQSPSLADVEAYRRTVAQSPAQLATFAYFDIATLIRRSGMDTSQLGPAAQYLEGAVLDLVQERGVSRVAGAVTAQ